MQPNLKALNNAATALTELEVMTEPWAEQLEVLVDLIQQNLSEQGADALDIEAFLLLWSDTLSEGRFCPKVGRFSNFLMLRWERFCLDNNITLPADVEEDQVTAAPEPVSVTDIKVIKKHCNGLFKEVMAGDQSAAHDLLEYVGRLARHKIGNRMHDSSDADESPEDLANRVCEAVAKVLVRKGKKVTNFFSWLNRVIFVTGADGFTTALEADEEIVPFLTTIENTDGQMEEVQNSAPRAFRRGKREVAIPPWIAGRDLQVCEGILKGLNYKAIGDVVGLTEPGVKSLLMRLKQFHKLHGISPLPNRGDYSLNKRQPILTQPNYAAPIWTLKTKTFSDEEFRLAINNGHKRANDFPCGGLLQNNFNYFH